PGASGPGADDERRTPAPRRRRGRAALPLKGEAGNLLVARAAEPPGGDHEGGHDRDPEQGEDGDPRLASSPVRTAHRRAPGLDRVLLLPGRETRVVLVHERLAVEAKSLGVRAEEALDVRRRREDVEALVLEREQVLRPDLGGLLELGEVESLAEPG